MSISDDLDYYHFWLGISPEEQPPTLYRLLGIRCFEADPAVISNAAERQMLHTRTYLHGPHGQLAQKVLNELASAKSCLLDPDAKREYDLQIKRTMFPPEAPPIRSIEASRAAPSPRPARSTTDELLGDASSLPTSYRRKIRPAKKRRENDWTAAIALALFAAITILVAIVFNLPTSDVEVAEQVRPFVVQIDTDNGSFGSGVIVDVKGLVLTNYHVVAGAESATIKTSDGNRLNVLGYISVDPGRDLLLLKTIPFPLRSAAKIAGANPKQAERVLACGSPAKLGFSTSTGSVSAVRTGVEVSKQFGDDTYERLGYTLDAYWIQHTAPLSPGNSGGPLFNMRGELVGINTWTLKGGQNLNFAIAGSDIKHFLEDPDREFSPNLRNLTNPRSEDAPGADTKPVEKAPTIRAPADTVPSAAKPVNPPAKEASDKETQNPAVQRKSLFDPFPSGQIYSPGIFDVDVERIAKVLEKNDTNLVTIRHPNGEVFAVASHLRGTLNGLCVGRYDNKRPMVFANYYQGKLHGTLETWNDRGEPVLFRQYIMGRLNGFTCFYDEGELRLLIEYKSDRPQWIRRVDGPHVVHEASNRIEANQDATMRDLLEKLDSTERTIGDREAEFKRQVYNVELQRRKKRAIELGPQRRAETSAKNAIRDAADEAARQEFARGMINSLTTPGRTFTVPVK